VIPSYSPNRSSGFQLKLIIPKSGRQFKGDISTDKAGSRPYRTIVLQASQAQRVTKADFVEKKCQKIEKALVFATEKSGP
jgi:hypothetical protein